MTLFKNPNESAYVGGRKHWTDVIKNTGNGEYLIWRQPEEDFNTNSTLVVMPGEAAIFVKSGVIEQVFQQEGTYKLSTNNYPFISRLRNAFSGGISTFNCVVYFVRKAHSVEILWGTDSPIQVRDKVLDVATKIRARGSYKVQVDNPEVFLKKLIGNNVIFQAQQELNKYFIQEFQSKIKSILARILNETESELLGIDTRLDELSQSLQPHMQQIISEYGLKCVKFVVSAIDIEDDALRRRYDEIGMEALERRKMANVNKDVLEILGNDWGRVQDMEIQRTYAKNSNLTGVVASGAMGLFGTGGQQSAPIQGNTKTIAERLRELKELLEAGYITQEDFDKKKEAILAEV